MKQKRQKAEPRVLYINGYRLIYVPEYYRAMKSKGYNGYVYEHIWVTENSLGRHLSKDEYVHHLDGDKTNNRISNLIVLSARSHGKLHSWIASGTPGIERFRLKRVNSAKPKESHCVVCGTVLDKQDKFCSIKCSAFAHRRTGRPEPEILKKETEELGFSGTGRKYNVTDNAIRKWLRSMVTLSQAVDTSTEGAETTGEVEPS